MEAVLQKRFECRESTSYKGGCSMQKGQCGRKNRELWEKWRNRATKLVSLMERRGRSQSSEVGRGSIM